MLRHLILPTMPEIINSAASQHIDGDHDEPGDDEEHFYRGVVQHRLSEGRGIQFIWDLHMFCHLILPMMPEMSNSAVFTQ